MDYTPERQEADKNFLIGARFGRDTERARIIKIAKALPDIPGAMEELIRFIEETS